MIGMKKDVKTRVMIADDHQLIVDGMCQILEGNARYEVVATANSGGEVMQYLKKEPVDIAVLDIEMPPPDGIELTRLICEEYPDVSVLILTMHNTETFISEVMTLGSNRKRPEGSAGDQSQFGIGFILKNKGQEELVDALDALSLGKNFYGKEVMDTILNSWTQTRGRSRQSTPEESESLEERLALTKREKQVLKLIAQGKSGPSVAEELFVANSTIETHRRNLIAKCGVENTKELIRFAIKNGFD